MTRALITLVCLLSPLSFGQFTWFVDSDAGGLSIHVQTPVPAITAEFPMVAFSADRVVQRVHTLADGTRLTDPAMVQHVVVDTQGNTRTETPLFRNGASWNPTVIQIMDPAGGFMYIAFEGDAVVYKLTHQANPRALAARERQPPGKPSSRTIEFKDGRKETLETLEARSIDGVTAAGTRETMIYPAGARGNDRPLTIVHEVWYSPDFGTLLAKIADPTAGESTTKLQNIKPITPDPALFQPPSAYPVTEISGPFMVHLKRP